MAFSTDLYIVQKGSTTKKQVIGTKQGDVYVAKRLPDYAELVNAGKVWQALDTVTNAALVARPTTLSGLTIQNPPASGKTLVILSLMAYTDLVPATLGTVSVWHCVHKLGVVLYTRDLLLAATGAGAPSGLKGGQGAYPGSIIIDRGATVVDDGWVPTPLKIVSNIATTNFTSDEAALIAPVIIPSGFHYSLQTLATVVGFETALGITWAELDDDEL